MGDLCNGNSDDGTGALIQDLNRDCDGDLICVGGGNQYIYGYCECPPGVPCKDEVNNGINIGSGGKGDAEIPTLVLAGKDDTEETNDSLLRGSSSP